jgi:hypothetical protein
MANLRCFFEKIDLRPLGINGILQISFQNIYPNFHLKKIGLQSELHLSYLNFKPLGHWILYSDFYI